MSSEEHMMKRLKTICARDERYALEAYQFVQAGVTYTQEQVAQDVGRKSRHVSGPELLSGMRALALEQFGPMARTVLAEWGIHTTRDFGNIVFNMIEDKILGAKDSDQVEDFDDGYTFESAFTEPFLPRGTAEKPPVIDG